MQKFIALLFAAAAGGASAQDCASNLYMTANAKLQVTVYDKKGGASGVQTVHITDVKKNGGGYQSTVTTAVNNDKGKTVANGAGTYKCSGGALSADIKMSVPQEQMGQMGQTEAEMQPVYIEYPASPSVGQKLQDAEAVIKMKMNGGMDATMNVKQEARTVASKESVTSPAGTWEAYVITYNGSVKMKMGIVGLPTFNFTVKEWYVPGMGVVKTESYNKGGKLTGSTLLTGVTK